MKEFFQNFHHQLSVNEKRELCKIITGFADCEEKEVPWLDKDKGVVLLLNEDDVPSDVEHIGIQIEWEPEFKISNCMTMEDIQLDNTKLDELNSYISKLNDIVTNRLGIVNSVKTDFFSKVDGNQDGVLDIIQSKKDFNLLLKSNQSLIIEKGRQYIHEFVKISNYLISKGDALQEIFEEIKNVKNETKLTDLIGLLEDQVYYYNLIFIHSTNMIISLTKDDMITFYEIYESFDKSNVFQSNWEREIKDKLEGIEAGIESVLNSIESLERNLVNGISNLSYITQSSFKELQDSVIEELEGIQSSINFNNLLTGVQTYQLYKINKNTKGLLE